MLRNFALVVRVERIEMRERWSEWEMQEHRGTCNICGASGGKQLLWYSAWIPKIASLKLEPEHVISIYLGIKVFCPYV